MLALLRAAVTTVVETVSDHVYPEIPDDPAELPCVVIGLPRLSPSTDSDIVFDVRVDVYVIGSRSGGPGTEVELVELTDVVFGAFGGSRGVNTGSDTDAGQVGVIAVDEARPTRLEIAGKQYPAYTLTVATDLMTC